MTDFNCQFVSTVVPVSTAVALVNAPSFNAVNDFARAFLIPAGAPHTSAGAGRTSNTLTNSFGNVKGLCELLDVDTIEFDDLNNAQFRDNLMGCWLVEYVGPVGGVNEVIVRAVQRFSGTAAQFDGPAIAGIVNLADCVPFAFVHSTLNNNAFSNHFARVSVVNDGTNNVVRVNKTDATNSMEVTVYVVEFVGPNWSVQAVNHTFAAADANEDETISAVNLAQSFTYTTYQSALTGTQNVQHLYYVWLETTTVLRHRLEAFVSAPAVRTYVISNPQLAVTVYGTDPDGVEDLAAGGAAPETRTIAITPVPILGRAFALGYCGSNSVVTTTCPAAVTLIDLQDASTLRLRRSDNVGGTEYKIQVIDMSGVIGLAIDSVDPIVDGSNFDINGNFGTLTGDGVTLGGVVQPAVSANATVITRTAALGTLFYGQPYDLVVTAGGTASVQASIEPAAGRDYVNLSTLAPIGGRLTAIPDLAPGDQIEWFNVVGGTIADVEVFDDASFNADPAVTSFDFRVNDGEGWGTAATQTIGDIPVELGGSSVEWTTAEGTAFDVEGAGVEG